MLCQNKCNSNEPFPVMEENKHVATQIQICCLSHQFTTGICFSFLHISPVGWFFYLYSGVLAVNSSSRIRRFKIKTKFNSSSFYGPGTINEKIFQKDFHAAFSLIPAPKFLHYMGCCTAQPHTFWVRSPIS